MIINFYTAANTSGDGTEKTGSERECNCACTDALISKGQGRDLIHRLHAGTRRIRVFKIQVKLTTPFCRTVLHSLLAITKTRARLVFM